MDHVTEEKLGLHGMGSFSEIVNKSYTLWAIAHSVFFCIVLGNFCVIAYSEKESAKLGVWYN